MGTFWIETFRYILHVRGTTRVRISAQVSIYPLRQKALAPIIEDAIETWQGHGLAVEPGPMSSLVTGEEAELFAGLQAVFQHASLEGDVVMTITLSNACPVENR